LEGTEPKYIRNNAYIFRKVVDELILVPVHKNVADMDAIYTLNEVAAFLWELLEQPKTKAEMQLALMDNYSVDPDVAAQDLNEFLESLQALGAIIQD
jgi:hypothetical protein